MKKAVLKAVICLLLNAVPQAVFAQLQDTLDEQTISGKRVKKSIAPGLGGLKIAVIDSNALMRAAQNSLTQTLVERLPVFIRNTGVNGPATLSIRGASAAQSMVMWEGIPLQNAAMGMTDLSLLQSGVFRSIQLIEGGSPALWGSGNVGGVLLLEGTKSYFSSKPETDFRLSFGGGSYDLVLGSVGISHKRSRSFWAINALSNRCNYAFDFNPGNAATKRIDPARMAQMSTLLTAAQNHTSGWQTRQDLWWQKTARDIPPALFESQSNKIREDEALRLRLGAEKEKGSHHFTALAALMTETLNYQDADINLKSNLKTTTVFGRFRYHYRFAKGRFFTDIPVQYAIADDGARQYAQSSIAIANGAERFFLKDKIYLSGAIRVEHTGVNTAFLPGINARFRLLQKGILHTSLQRTYRAAMLNELYTFPGGNPDLKPEQGWSADLGWRQEFRPRNGAGNAWSAYVDATVFHRNIQDWIIWYGGAIWTPHNVARVQTQGLEIEGEVHFKHESLLTGIRPGITFTNAKTLESMVPNDGSVGRQIPHTPLQTGRMGLWISFKKMQLDLTGVYTGYRFITSDESAWIPAYKLFNGGISYSFKTAKANCNLEFRCNNLANEQYLAVAGRPGLPRHYLAGFLLRF